MAGLFRQPLKKSSAVRAMLEEDVRVTASQIQVELAISSGSVPTILHEKLHLSKISTRWVPYMLTQEHADVRVQWCHDMLARFNGGQSNASDESGDESWVYSFESKSKKQSAQWAPVGEAPPQKFRRERSAARQMVATFVAKADPVTAVLLVTQQTITADWYVEYCLSQVLDVVAHQRPRTLHREFFSSSCEYFYQILLHQPTR